MVFSKIPAQLPTAMAHYEEAMRIKSTYVGARNHLANALAAIPGRLPEAIRPLRRGRAAQTGFSRSALQLAAAYAEAGRLELRSSSWRSPPDSNPTSPTIRDNLEKLKARRNQ